MLCRYQITPFKTDHPFRTSIRTWFGWKLQKKSNTINPPSVSIFLWLAQHPRFFPSRCQAGSRLSDNVFRNHITQEISKCFSLANALPHTSHLVCQKSTSSHNHFRSPDSVQLVVSTPFKSRGQWSVSTTVLIRNSGNISTGVSTITCALDSRVF